jgi:hypothetical protein
LPTFGSRSFRINCRQGTPRILDYCRTTTIAKVGPPRKRRMLVQEKIALAVFLSIVIMLLLFLGDAIMR